jgi:hypothetical protein
MYSICPGKVCPEKEFLGKRAFREGRRRLFRPNQCRTRSTGGIRRRQVQSAGSRFFAVDLVHGRFNAVADIQMNSLGNQGQVILQCAPLIVGET